MYPTRKDMMWIVFAVGAVACDVTYWLVHDNFGVEEVILITAYGVWAWWILRRPRPLQSFKYEVSVSKPDNHSSARLIERSKHHGYF